MQKSIILCVDDEKIILTSLKEQLRRYFQGNYVIETVESGEEALELLDEFYEERIDLPIVIVDQIMPGMKGDELLIHIHRSLPKTLKIMLTGQANADAVGNAVNRANLYRYIAKPWEEADLIMTVTEALRSYGQEKKLEEQNALLQQMNQNLEQINAAYQRFVPREFLSFLQKASILDVRLGDQVQKDMTVMFSDIRGFTSLSEKMTPEENFQFINSYLSQMEPVIRTHHGFVDKYNGDAIMALFPTTANDAVDGAIAMLKQLTNYNLQRTREGAQPIRIGLGLNTGTLMLGTVGGPGRMDSTVISDAVNLAARLEGLTKRFGASLLMSEYTLRELHNDAQYHIRFLGKVQVKGKNQAVAVYEIYDGDADELLDIKMKTTANFEEGLCYYFAGEFAEAAVMFKNVLKENPTDKTAKLYLERAAQFMVHGVPEGWQGIEAMESK